LQNQFASGAAGAGLTLAQGAGTAVVSGAQDIAARGSSAGALVGSLLSSVVGASSSAASSAATAVGSRVLGIGGGAAADPNAAPAVRLSPFLCPRYHMLIINSIFCCRKRKFPPPVTRMF
jgi:hypothetical protein